MHIVTKIFIVLNLLVCLVLSQYVWVSLAGNVQWREKFENERDARHRDKNHLSDAYNELLAARADNSKSTAQNSSELSGMNATQHALEAWAEDAQQSAADAQRSADDLMTAVAPFDAISEGYREDVVEKLQNKVKDLIDQKTTVFNDRGERLLGVARGHNDYALRAEEYRELEFHHFLLQEELEDRRDVKARYRWLRPDIQRELGDNGPVIIGDVQWVVGNSLQINKGRRDGVELHQKFTIRRNGVTVAVVDVVEVQNETSEAVVIDLVRSGDKPKAGDDAITRLFMVRLHRGK